ncbi:MAG: hydrogenase maturation protease [Candidatus Baltobacteraceae bacterium]
MSARVLVAGIGNIFFGDDGFGCEVARRMASEPLATVKVEDFGIRGLHLAYELVAGYDGAVLIDAVPRGGAPGTLYVIEPDLRAGGGPPDAHRMDVQNVFAFVRVLGAEPPPILIVGCEPAVTDEGMGLSEAVAAALADAEALVRRTVARLLAAQSARIGKETACCEV